MTGRAYIVGGGIAALASAILLIRRAQFSGQAIHIFEASGVLGGSLDGCGDPADGYVIRGGRMFEEHFGCTYETLAGIPSLDDPEVSVTDDIKRFTADTVSASRGRLVINGQPEEAPGYGLSLRDKFDLIRLTLRRENKLGDMAIEDYFRPGFFDTNFWVMWSTMFAFQRWHSLVECRRYMRRFIHLLPGFSRLRGIHRTRFNQYDAIVTPCVRWLAAQGVNFHLHAPVRSVSFDTAHRWVTALEVVQDGQANVQTVDAEDLVFITLGSMTEASTLGCMSSPPVPRNGPDPIGAWSLWRQLAADTSLYGRPEVFGGDISKTHWVSFTVTLPKAEFFAHMEAFTRTPAGAGGLVTFKHSGWMLSVVLAHQPHFANQPEDCWVFWGYGLHPWNVGDAVPKPMLKCSGEEILHELAHHLRLDADAAAAMFENANCIPCVMPFITSQFMPRKPGDRPPVVVQGAENYAFIGQFCELPEDTVFTVEYSVRSAQQAVLQLCRAGEVTKLYRGMHNPKVVGAAVLNILGNG